MKETGKAPSGFGLWPVVNGENYDLRDGNVQNYLERIEGMRRLFRTDEYLHGMVEAPGSRGVLTSQEALRGSIPSPRNISTGMEKMGFVRVKGFDFYRPWDRTAVFDLHPGNLLKSKKGRLLVYDAIVAKAWPELHEVMMKKIKDSGGGLKYGPRPPQPPEAP